MNKKRLLKSIIGTVVIYGVLLAFIFIFRDIIDFLVYLPVLIAAFAACSIAAGLLFKGEIYAAVWSAATAIFYVALWGFYDFEWFILGLGIILAPLFIPFFIIKAGFWLKEEEKKEKSRLE